MLSDINLPKIKGIGIAIEIDKLDSQFWPVYLINKSEFNIRNVLVVSKGYVDDEEVSSKTGVFRHFIENVESGAAYNIELLDKQLINLNHEYWISYQWDNHLLERKITFVVGTFNEKLITPLPFGDKQGIYII